MLLRLAAPIALALCACARRERAAPDARPTAAVDAAPARDVAQLALPAPPIAIAPPAPAPAQQRWIAAGGGSWPGSNQVSLAQDLAQLHDVLTGPGLVLFASGPGARVQVLDREERGDPLLNDLAALFDDRAGRDAHYEPAPITPHAPATAESLLAALRSALSAASDPLLLYVAAHGVDGETPRDGAVVLWGDSELGVSDLAQALDATPTRRTLRMVITACYGGAFADVVFRDAREEQGAAPTLRCGLFASTWDREAAGCDPDPDRRAQQGYGIHFMQALRGRDHDGNPLPLGVLDLDGDGRVSLLEAHTRARIAGQSIDVPTTTSERWLRHAAPDRGPSRAVSTPEDDAVVAALGRRLGLPPDAARVRARLESIEEQRRTLGAQIDTAQDLIDAANRALMADLLARWPVLDDPWHPDWASTIETHRAEIETAMHDHATRTTVEAASTEHDALAARDLALETESATVERFLRALENRELAGRLRALGGEGWEYYQRLLACERSAP